jgi:hypothetical protein
MQQAGRDDEADAVGDGVSACRKLGAVRVSVKDRENPNRHRRHPMGSRAANATIKPNTTAEMAMAASVPSSGTSRMPSTHYLCPTTAIGTKRRGCA